MDDARTRERDAEEARRRAMMVRADASDGAAMGEGRRGRGAGVKDEGAGDSAKTSSESRGAGSSSEGEACETNKTRAVGQEKRRGCASAEEEEAWEAREKRRRKGKHGKSRRERREKARATTDESAKAREDVDMGSESTSSGGARDLDSARASPPLSDEVSEATADGEANIPLVGAQVVVGVAFEQGQRAYMEDRYSAVTELKPFGLTGCDGVRRSFLGVYDGHNGDWAAQFASERMHAFLAPDVLLRDSSPSCPEELTRFNADMETSLKKMYMDCDDEILNTTAAEGRRDGSTAVCVLQVGGALFTAHAGDSRAVVSYADGRTRAMTEDHKPSLSNERRRITAVGGKIEFCGCWRVIADHPYKPMRAALAVSRSLGDIDFKRPKDSGVTAEPDVSRYELTEDINFIILASDGMWDVIRDQEAGDIARKILAMHGVLSEGKCTSTDKKAIEAACTAASQELLDTSMHRGSSDNVTVVVAMYLH